MKPRILLYGRLMPLLETLLELEFDCKRLAEEVDPEAYLAVNGHEFKGIVTAGFADEALMDACPNVKVISNFGVGADRVDLVAAASKGIVVTKTTNVLDDCVADLAMGLIINVARGICEADRFVRRGDWNSAAFPLRTKVSGKRMGIVGLGRIGNALARRAMAFDIEIAYHNRSPVTDTVYRYEASLAALAQWSDFLVVIVPGGVATRGLISAHILTALGPEGYLINVSRGTVIDERALVIALLENRLGGAALDVFENEPKVPIELQTLDNVVLLPHIGSATKETRKAMAQRVVDNLKSHISNEILKN